jgi:hypothetical protein
MAKKLSQLTFTYHGLSLSAHREAGLLRHTRVRAGDRTPDVLFVDARTGAQTSLFAMLGQSKPIALIGIGRGSRNQERIARIGAALARLGVECATVLSSSGLESGKGLVDNTGDFGRLYGARGEFLYLIRPDGYVGLFQHPIDERALWAYLANVFAPELVARSRQIAAGREQSEPFAKPAG